MDPHQHGNARVTILPPSLHFQSTSSKNSYNSNCSNTSNNSNDNNANSKAQEGTCLGYASSEAVTRTLVFLQGSK